MSKLSEVLKAARGKGVNIGGYDEMTHEHGGISTGLVGIDRHLETGGFPRGRISQVLGEQNSGKSNLLLGTMATLHSDWDAGRVERGRVFFINAERGFSAEYAQKLGVQLRDPNKTIHFSPDDGIEALDYIEQVIDTGEIDLVVLDSITGMIPRGLLAMDPDKNLPAVQARQNGMLAQRLIGRLARTNTAFVYVNHMAGGFQQDRFGNTIKKARGGDMLQNFTSFTLRTKKTARPVGEDGKPVVEANDSVATMVNIIVDKNKVGRQFQEIPARLEFFSGFDQVYDVVQEALTLGILNKASGSWVYLGTKESHSHKWISENAARQGVAEDAELFQQLRRAVLAAA